MHNIFTKSYNIYVEVYVLTTKIELIEFHLLVLNASTYIAYVFII